MVAHHQCFATYGENDCLLRVWVPEIENKYFFVYLPHPRAVVNVVWEKNTDLRRLLTSAKDGLARIWIWSSISNLFQLVFTLDPPAPSLVGYHFFDKRSIVVSESLSLLLKPASQVSKPETSADPELSSLLEQFDELVFAMEENGTMSIWGISNLDRRLGDISSSIVRIVPNCVRMTSSMDTFLNLQLVHHTHIQDTDHLFLIGFSSSSGSLSCFSVQIGSLIYRPDPTLHLVHEWGGHVQQGPKFLYLLDENTLLSQSGNEAIVWKLHAGNLGAGFLNSKLTFLQKSLASNSNTITFPFDSPLTLHRHSAHPNFIEFDDISIRSVSENVLLLSLIGHDALATYTLPECKQHYLHSFPSKLTTAAFAMYPTQYDAVALDTACTLFLFGRDQGAPLYEHSFSSWITSEANVQQLALSGNILACRTPQTVHVFSLRLFTHEPSLLMTLNLAASSLSLSVPTPGMALLATSSDSTLHIYSPANNPHPTTPIFEHTFASRIECFQFTYSMEVVLFVDDALQFLSPFPPFLSLLPRTPLYHPDSLRTWLAFPDGIERVQAILNHLYYSFQASLPQTPLFLPSHLLPLSTTADVNAGSELEALFQAQPSTSFFDQADSMHRIEEETSWSSQKASALKDAWLQENDPARPAFVAVMDLLPELQSISLDVHGKRYFAEFRMHIALSTPMSVETFVFAFFSESQSSLADLLFRSCTLTWSLAKSLGVGWWMHPGEYLETILECIARNQWRKASDPLDCFYFYLLLPKKRKLLLNLWKQAHGHPDQRVISQFLEQEVTEKWKKTALKNAFVLLGKLRYELAACFFILAEAYTDAVMVCLKNLDDVQLAWLTCRVFHLSATPVLQYLEAHPEHPPGLLFLCKWTLGETAFDVDVLLPESPTMYLLYQSIREKVTLVASKATTTCPLQLRALSHVLSYYRDRNAAYFCYALLHDMLRECEAAASKQPSGVDDAFAALFGESMTQEKNALSDDPLFESPSSAPKDSFFTLTPEDVLSVERLIHQMFAWETLQSTSTLVHAPKDRVPETHPYFKGYLSALHEETRLDPILAARLCDVMLSPNHSFFSDFFQQATRSWRIDLYRRAFTHLLHAFYATSLQPSAMTLVIQTLQSLAHPELCTDCCFSSNTFQLLLLSVLYLFHAFCVSINYTGLAILLQHFPALLVLPAQPTIQTLYTALEPHLTSFTPSSPHLILEFLACKMMLTKLEALYYELLGDHPVFCKFLMDTCFPLLHLLLQRYIARIQWHQLHVCSPAEDWLSIAQQELHASITYDPVWLDELRPSRLVEDPVSFTSSSSSISSSSFTIDTLFKNEYPILSMGLNATCKELALALHKHVVEININLSYASHPSKQGTSHSEREPPAHPVDTLQVPPSMHHDSSATFIASSIRTPDFNLLKKVHLPRSNSEHLNLVHISSEPGFVMERSVFPVSIASHPTLNLYALGQYVDNKSSLSLYAFHVKKDQMPISHYGSAKIVKLLFDSNGSRLGIADGNGELGLFDVESWRSFYNLPCHVRYTSDLVFYNKDSLIATTGSSPGHVNNVTLWDTLMPMNYAKVRGYNIHESGASAITTDGNYIVSGGKKGDLYVLDIRHSKPLFTLQASHNCVSALALQGSKVFSGSTDGTLRVYDLSASALTEVYCCKLLHQSKKLIQTSLNQLPVSTLGITQIIARDNYVLTCGADGLVKWLH